jgi:hypothetical protein
MLSPPFPGDLRDKYYAVSSGKNSRELGGPGTYTRQKDGTEWTKQGAEEGGVRQGIMSN